MQVIPRLHQLPVQHQRCNILLAGPAVAEPPRVWDLGHDQWPVALCSDDSGISPALLQRLERSVAGRLLLLSLCCNQVYDAAAVRSCGASWSWSGGVLWGIKATTSAQPAPACVSLWLLHTRGNLSKHTHVVQLGAFVISELPTAQGPKKSFAFAVPHNRPVLREGRVDAEHVYTPDEQCA